MAGKQKRKKQKEPPVPALLPNPLGTEMPNYITYRMTWAETLLAAALAFAAGGICSQVFYGGLFLRDGEIVERGTAQQLIEQDGAFAAIWKLQTSDGQLDDSSYGAGEE